MNISDILFEANIPTIKNMISKVCEEYETNPKYTVKKFYENLRLVGFYVYNQEGIFRNLAEIHYIGKNRFTALKMFREMTNGVSNLRAIVQKVNERIWKVLLKMGFKIVEENFNNYILERGESNG